MKKLFWIAVLLALLPGLVVADRTVTLQNVTQINETGFGDEANRYAFSMAEHNGSLYVGTLNVRSLPKMFNFFTATETFHLSNGAEVWRYDRDGSWTQVVDDGLQSKNNIGVRKMVSGRGCLWGVTANHQRGMEVWRTCDGDNWEVVAKDGFGNSHNTSGRGLGFFGDYIYVGTENRTEGAQLWRSADGRAWDKVADGGISDPANWWVSDFAEFKGRLYMGTLNAGGCQVFRTHDGRHFERVAEGGLEKPTNFAAMKLYVFKDRLFLTTMDFFNGFDLYVSDDGVDFTRVLKDGYTDSQNGYLWQLQEYNGRLYGGTYAHNGAKLPTGEFTLYSSEDGIDWTVETDNAFGNPWYYGVRSMAVFDGKLVIGTASARYGAKILAAEAAR